MKDIKVRLIVLGACLAATFLLFVYVVHTMPPDDPGGHVTVMTPAAQKAVLEAKLKEKTKKEPGIKQKLKTSKKKNNKWSTFYGTDPSVHYIDPKYSRYDKLHVFALKGLPLRVEPDAKAEAVVTIPYGEKVTVLDPSENTKITSAGWNRGRWIFIQWSGERGYIFDSYLSRLPAPRIRSRLYYDRLPDGTDYSEILKQYANTFLIPNNESFKFKFEVSCQNRKGRKQTRITFDGVRVMDVYHLAETLIKNSACARKNLKKLRYVKDKTGRLYKIQSSRSPIRIIRTENDKVRLTMTF